MLFCIVVAGVPWDWGCASHPSEMTLWLASSPPDFSPVFSHKATEE